jgi:2-polyprenyl-3-methyl-5-hydroxy-6-metoxy-1,4-benzoquinol methylase
MPIPADYSFIRYLAAKRSVDDRALNRHVWQSLEHSLSAANFTPPVRVLEVGAGIGTMVERVFDWGLLKEAVYTAMDAEPSNVAEAQVRLSRWAARQGFTVWRGTPAQIQLQQAERKITVELEAIDVHEFAAREQERRTWDVLIAHAFLDLMDIPSTLPMLFSLLRPGGLFYSTLTFDGATVLQPEMDSELDAHIEALYHQTMDRRITAGRPSGDSQSGRHLFGHLRDAGAELLDAGSSDWVVFAGPGGYPADEVFFLHFIIHTIRMALQGHPDLDAARFADWIEQRHQQIERGELVYIAHQLDFLGRKPVAPAGSHVPA